MCLCVLCAFYAFCDVSTLLRVLYAWCVLRVTCGFYTCRARYESFVLWVLRVVCVVYICYVGRSLFC